MIASYYNTNGLSRRQLLDANVSALNQEQRILRFFIQQGRTYSGSPSAVAERVFDNSVPLTSVRRAMTNLTARGDLDKTAATVQGAYGKPEHLWTIAPRWSDKPSQRKLL